MLSIGKVKRGSSGKQYYLRLSEEDYYLRGAGKGEPPGEWWGRGAVQLGLVGPVDAQDFGNAFDGYSPSGEPLSRNVNQDNRRPAFDLTYSVPKSLSVVRAVADRDMQTRIDEAIMAATRSALDYMEREATFTRIGAQGAQVIAGRGLTVATFNHLVSRELDPQAHVHCVVFNFTQSPDGRYRTLEGGSLFDAKMTSGAIFRAELSTRVEALGFEVERDRFAFRLKGAVSQDLLEEFSKRSEQIRKAAGEGASAARKARETLKTREPKGDVDRDKLLEEWREVSSRHGLTAETVRELSRHAVPERDVSAELRETMAEAMKRFEQSGESTFTTRKLVEHAAVEAQCRGLSSNDVRLRVWATLEYARRGVSKDLVFLGEDVGGDGRFTTRRLFELEREVLQAAEWGRTNTGHRVSDGDLQRALSGRSTIKDEQREAVGHITQDPGSIKLVCGWAGTGKTYMLDCARDAWERGGFRVIGGAVAGKAARGLAEEAQIPSGSVAKLLYDFDHPGPNATFQPPDSKTVIVIDESGMLGSHALHRLVTECERANAKLVLVGDEHQLQSVDSGGGFSGLVKRLGYAELKEITRQRDEIDRQAVYDMARGQAGKALKSYAERGRLVLGEDKDEALRTLVSDWQKDTSPIEERLILTSTNAQTDDINRMVNAARREAGEVGEVAIPGGQDGVCVNDRIRFTKRAGRFGIENGDLATVTGFDEARRSMSIRLDNGNRVTVPLEQVKDFRLGYSVTSHAAQGSTVENAYIFVYGSMTSSQLSYVQSSRARGVTRLYTTQDEAGPGSRDLVSVMSRCRKKALAHDMPRPSPPEREEQPAHRHRMRRSL